MNDGERRAVRYDVTPPESPFAPRREHFDLGMCDGQGCGYIVEEHQRYGKPEEGDVPEFTIEVTFKTATRGGIAAEIPGWRFVLKWMENGQQKQVRDYGYVSKENALMFAREKATEIAKALTPVHVETYRPEV